MEEKVYARLNLWDNQLLDHLDLGVSFFQVNQSSSPKEIKLDKNAKDPILKASKKIGRTIKLLYCNPAYVKQSGFTQEELLAVPNVALLSETVGFMSYEMEEMLWNNLIEDRPYNGIISWKRPNQRPSIVKFTAIPFSTGEEQFMLGITHDVTDYIQSQNKLNQTYNWLPKVCHDLHAPVALIQQGLFHFKDFPQDLPQIMSGINKACQYFNSLYKSSMHYGQIAGGELKLDPDWVNLRQICQNLEDLFSLSIKKKNLAWELDLPPGPVQLWIDPMALSRALQNLIGNAIKFTEKGQIKLACQLSSDVALGKGVRFCVSDTGMGISLQDQEAVLQPYVSLASSTTGEKGHGLGLAIVKEFAELLEGSVEVESVLHQGTTITISLPKTVHMLHS